MGGNVDTGPRPFMNYTPGMPPGYDSVQAALFGLPNRAPGAPTTMGGEGFGQQQLTPDMMANMQQKAQAAAQQGQGPMGLGQAAQTALTQQQMSKLGGLAALLGGNPTPPTPAVSAPPTARPAPVAAKPAPVAAKRAPVAAKPVAKPSAVPPKTPPAVASAIQKLAAKKKPFGRR